MSFEELNILKMLKWLSIAFLKCYRAITDQRFFHCGVLICLEILNKKKQPRWALVMETVEVQLHYTEKKYFSTTQMQNILLC